MFKQVVHIITNVNYSGRTAPLTSKFTFYIFIQQIYVPNILNVVYTLLFFSSKCSLFHNSNVFGSCIIHILYTGCAKIKKNNSGAIRLIVHLKEWFRSRMDYTASYELKWRWCSCLRHCGICRKVAGSKARYYKYCLQL